MQDEFYKDQMAPTQTSVEGKHVPTYWQITDPAADPLLADIFILTMWWQFYEPACDVCEAQTEVHEQASLPIHIQRPEHQRYTTTPRMHRKCHVHKNNQVLPVADHERKCPSTAATNLSTKASVECRYAGPP